MESFEIIALLVTGVGVVSFATIFTILYLSYANSSVSEYRAGQRDVELIEETIYNNINSTKRHRRLIRRLKQISFYVAIAILIPFLILSLYTKVSLGVAMIGGRGVIVVASGSMSEKNPQNPKYLKYWTSYLLMNHTCSLKSLMLQTTLCLSLVSLLTHLMQERLTQSRLALPKVQ